MASSNPDIAFVITDLEIGGVPLHLHRLASNMRSRGLQVAILSLAGIGPVGERMRAEDFNVFACGGRGGWDVRVLFRLRAHLRRLRPRLVHSFLFHANQACRIVRGWAGVPRDNLLCEIQTAEVERRWHLRVGGWTYRLCRFTIGNSPSVVDHLHTHAGIPRTRLRLVRGGVDVDQLRQAKPIDRSVLSIENDAPLMLWTGRLDPVKGLHHLLDAMALARKAADVRLLIAGDGPERSKLERQVASLSLSDAVHFLGMRDDVPRLLATCDLFVFPSQTEGLPNALLEAMALSRPIVTTDVAGCRDLIRDGETGLLVPFGRSSALADAIVRLVQHPRLAASLGTAAAQEVEARWTRAGTMDAYGELYDEVLSQRHS
ncbi:MAG: glycosyltransferase [Phycisphaerae bacterium]